MTVVKKFKIRNRLRPALFDGGGKRIDDAIQDAQVALETLSEACATTIRDTVARIDAEFGSAANDRDSRTPADLYALNIRLIEACSPSGSVALADASRCLCDLLDLCGEAERWDWPAVDVHIDALKLLTSGVDLGEQVEKQLIANLIRLLEHREQAA